MPSRLFSHLHLLVAAQAGLEFVCVFGHDGCPGLVGQWKLESSVMSTPLQTTDRVFCRAQVVAKDFFNVVTVSFRVLYVFAILEIGTRKILHFNVTAHPTAEWTLQQFLEAIPCEHDNRFFIVDRDGKFSADLRRSVRAMGVRWLRTPRRAPQANSYCERLIGRLGFPKDPLNRGPIRWAQRRHRRPIDDEMRRNLEDLVYISP